MASNTNVGVIVDPRGKLYVEWIIPNYCSLSQKADVCFESPPFYFLNQKWCIKIHPNGSRIYSNIGWIELYLSVLCPISSYSVTFQLGIKHLKEEIYEGYEFHTFNASLPIYGWNNFFKRNDLFRLMREHSPEGSLVIFCDAIADESIKDAASQTSFDSTDILCRDFQDLLQSGRKSDITIEVCGRVFNVHKLILESRSPVFAAMFDHNMREKNNRRVNISDCDPDAFHNFLQYVYTGKLEEISWDNAINLFTIADKYCMTELKEQCSEFMVEDLSVDNACDVLIIADRHNEAKLKKLAEKLLIENMATVKTTEKWRTFVAQNALLAVEILMKFVPDESSY